MTIEHSIFVFLSLECQGQGRFMTYLGRFMQGELFFHTLWYNELTVKSNSIRSRLHDMKGEFRCRDAEWTG